MKKVLFALVAFAAIAVSCAKIQEPVAPEQPAAPEIEGVEFTLSAATTKTVADGFATKWVAGDKINVFNAPAEGAFASQGAFAIDEAGLADGTFTGVIAPLEADAYSWVAVYPYAEANADLAALALNIGAAEVALATAPALAGENIPLIGAAADVAKDDAVAIKMDILASAIALTVKNENTVDFDVNEIALTFPVAVAGAFTVNASDLAAVQYAAAEGASNTITLKANAAATIAAGESATFYAPIAPVTIAKDSKIQFSINGEGGELTATADIVFKAGKIKAMSVKAPKIILPTNLSENGTANCYIVSEAGKYVFDATVKGNGAEGIYKGFPDQDPAIAPASAKILWTEADGLVSDLALANGKISFTASGNEGNFAIAALDASENVLWSWHIWCTSSVNDVTVSGDKYVFMDRNLGAYAVEDCSFYYEWGRKDPFLGGNDNAVVDHRHLTKGDWEIVTWVNAGVEKIAETWGADVTPEIYHSIAFSISHPTAYIGTSSVSSYNDGSWAWLHKNEFAKEYAQWLWGKSHHYYDKGEGSTADPRVEDGNGPYAPFKSVYDPCPVGYMVCTPSALSEGNPVKVSNGVNFYDGALFVPHSGFLYNVGTFGYDENNNWTGLWSCESSWGGEPSLGFRLSAGGSIDCRNCYGPAAAHPVRCMKAVFNGDKKYNL